MSYNYLPLDHTWLHFSQVKHLLDFDQRISITFAAHEKILACRSYLDKKMEEKDRLFYGINTGFGFLQNVKIDASQIEQLQYNLLVSHACGLGEEVPEEIVKLMLMLKIKSLSYGNSGVQIDTVIRLMDMYNNGVLPVIYTQGSLGASGDLAPLSHLSLPLIGLGEVYLGTDGPLNIYLNNFVLFKRSEQLELSSKINALIYSSQLPAESILPDFNALFDSLNRIQDSYIAANPSPYQWILENEGHSDYYGEMITKYVGKIMDDALWQKIIHFKPYLVSNSSANLYRNIAFYIKFFPNTRVMVNWKDIASLPDLNSSEKLMIDSLKNSESMQPLSPYTSENIKKWTKQLNPRIQKLSFEKSLARNIHVMDSMFSPAKADYLKFQLVESTDINEQELAFTKILHSMHTPWSKAVLENEYALTVNKVNEINKTLAQSKRGKLNNRFGKSLVQTSFGATLYKTSDTKALDFMTKLKENFPGKAIIIDRWATWCGPCLNEMPHSKELVETSKDLPVVFVYLCTINNSSEEKWKSKVVEIKQPGTHFLINEELDADISKYFSFSGYPGYAFIDKTGTYKPGALKWIYEIENRESLLTLINK